MHFFPPFVIGGQSEVGGLAFLCEPLTSFPFMAAKKQRQRGSHVTFDNATRLKPIKLLLLNHPSHTQR